MTAMNQIRILNDLHLIVGDEAKYLEITEEMLKKAREEHFNNDIVNFYLLDLTNNPNYNQDTLNRFIIINDTMYKKFMKNISTNKEKANKEIFKIFKEILEKDFVIIVKHHPIENYWELIILKYPLALFNQSFFKDFLNNEEKFKIYENKQFSCIFVQPTIQINKKAIVELNKVNSDNVKEFIKEIFLLKYGSNNITQYLKDTYKFNSSKFNVHAFDLNIQKNLNDSGPSILSSIKEILESIESDIDDIENIDFHMMISEENCLNFRDMFYNKLISLLKDQNKIHNLPKKHSDNVVLPRRTYLQGTNYSNNFLKEYNSHLEQSKDDTTKDISMKLDSRVTKKVMSNLLHDILDRKTVGRLSKNSREEVRVNLGSLETRKSNSINNEESKDPPQSLPNNINREVIHMNFNPPESKVSGITNNEEKKISKEENNETSVDIVAISHRQVVYCEDDDITKIKFGERKEANRNLASEKDINQEDSNNARIKPKFSKLKIEKIINEFEFSSLKTKAETDPPKSDERVCCKQGACITF